MYALVMAALMVTGAQGGGEPDDCGEYG
jgi:hypothetical protein